MQREEFLEHAHSHHQEHEVGIAGGAGSRKRMLIALVLLAVYMIAELVGGLITNSLALMADAGHMLSDVGALAMSVFAMWIAQRPPTRARTYGFYRAEILAALINAATLVALSIYIFIEAYHRFRNPPAVQGGLMFGIAVGGLIINLIVLRLLHEGRSESLNLHGAWLHVLGDTLGSVGVIASAILIWLFDWRWADPLASAIISALIVYSSWALLKESVAVLMEWSPGHLNIDEVNRAIHEVEGVIEVHDLHVWTITSGMISLSCHIVPTDFCIYKDLLTAVREMLHQRFGIDHLTIQIEPIGFEEHPPCL